MTGRRAIVFIRLLAQQVDSGSLLDAAQNQVQCTPVMQPWEECLVNARHLG